MKPVRPVTAAGDKTHRVKELLHRCQLAGQREQRGYACPFLAGICVVSGWPTVTTGMDAVRPPDHDCDCRFTS